MAATTGTAAFLSPSSSCIRSSNSSSSKVSSPPPSPSISPSQKPHRTSLADQLRPLSTEFLKSPPPPARVWISPTRKKARDSAPQRDVKPAVQGSTISKIINHLTQEPDSNLAALLDSEVSSLTAKDIVAVLNAQTCWRRALFFLDWAKTKSFPMNKFVYNVTLKILRKADQWETGNALVEEMLQNNISPDNVTYSTIISFALRRNKPEEALGWFSRMQDAGCAPDAVTYCAVIDIYIKANRMDEAEELCSRMQQEIKPWGSVVYSQIMKLHGIRAEFDQMWDVYNEMLTAGIFPNVVTYNSLISLLGNSGRSMQAGRLLSDMLKHGLKPSPVTLSLMFRTFSKTRDIDEAFKLFEKIKTEGWKVDTVVYNSLLSLCAQMGRVEEGEKVYKELLASKVCRSDDWTWRILVDMYVKGGRFEEAKKITKEMVTCGRSIDLPVYMNLIQGHSKAKDFKSVLTLIDDIKSANFTFDHMLAGALLNSLVLCEEAGSEERLYLVEQIGLVYPNLKSVLENIYGDERMSASKLKESMRAMLNDSKEDGRKPLCNLLMDLCWVKQSIDQAQELLSMAIAFGLYPDLQLRSTIEWCLRLRTLSFGAACMALQCWVSSLHAAFQEEGRKLPEVFSIEVGLGMQPCPNDPVLVLGTVILKQLQEMNAPFQETRGGWLTASEADVREWLTGVKGLQGPAL